MESTVSDLEQRLSHLQAQMDRLARPSDESLESIEQRLSRLTDQCAEILKRWANTGERHARAVSQLEAHIAEWSDAGTRLQIDAAQRMGELERIVQHEWDALRQLHEEPVKQLSEQASSLTEVCIATANSAQHGFERAEARLAAIETDLHHRISSLTDELRAVVTELRARHDVERLAEPAAWPLDGVTRLHNQLREADGDSPAQIEIARRGRPGAPRTAGELPASPEPHGGEGGSHLAERVESLERAITSRDAGTSSSVVNTTRMWRLGAAAAIVILILGAAVAWKVRADIRAAAATAEQAQRESRQATAAAARDAATAREAAAREIALARDLATRAQTIGDVLTAPDLIRYNLRGTETAAAGQVLWSRSRGVVFSGSRLPAPPGDGTYQLWLLTRAAAVSAGTFVPDKSGDARIASPPPTVPRPVVGAMITIERAGGSDAPSGQPLIARFPVLQ